MFEEDPETEAIILLGEIGGRLEHDEAYFISHNGFCNLRGQRGIVKWLALE
jgi:succinyl-CoA synthetase alpha subunit